MTLALQDKGNHHEENTDEKKRFIRRRIPGIGSGLPADHGGLCDRLPFLSGKAEAEGEETLRSAIARAVVQCYAIEGRYPPSVEYLEENYGIQIDRERYYVFYEGFASNVMPDITVISAEE